MSIVAQMQKLYVEEKQVTTSEELLDITSVGRSLPGLMISNVAMIFGYHQAGLLGGLACAFGMIVPPFIVLSVLTYFYTAVQDNVWIVSAMSGVRAAIVPIIASAAINLVKGAFRYPPCVLITLVSFCLYLFLDINCVWLVILGAVSGLALCGFYEKRGVNRSGTA